MLKSYLLTQRFDGSYLANQVYSFLRNAKNMQAQVIHQEADRWIIQAKEGGAWKKIVAMDRSLTIELKKNGNALSVEIGQGKWIDKAAGVAIGLLLFWPALIPTAIGTVQQSQLPSQVCGMIEDTLITNGMISIDGDQYTSSQYTPESTSCDEDTQFCSACGKKLDSDAIFCKGCGNRVR